MTSRSDESLREAAKAFLELGVGALILPTSDGTGDAQVMLLLEGNQMFMRGSADNIKAAFCSALDAYLAAHRESEE